MTRSSWQLFKPNLQPSLLYCDWFRYYQAPPWVSLKAFNIRTWTLYVWILGCTVRLIVWLWPCRQTFYPCFVTKPPVVVNRYITFIILIIIFYGIQQTWVRHDIDCMETIYNLDIVNRNSHFIHNVHLWNFIIVISNINKIQYKNKINFVCNMGSSS